MFNGNGTREFVDRLFGPDADAWSLVSRRRSSVAVEGRVIAEQVRLLALSARCENITASLFTGCVAVVLWPSGDHLILCLWIVSNAVLIVVRDSLERRYRRTAPDIRDSSHPRWSLRFCACSLTAGVLWGGGMVLLLPPAEPLSAAFVLALHIAYITMASGLHAACSKAFVAFYMPAMIGLGAALLLSAHVVLAPALALLIAIGAASALLANRNARMVASGLGKRYAGDELCLRLADERDQAELSTRAKSRFIATAGHDLRQPVHAIGLLVGLLKSRQGSSDRDGIVDRIQQSIDSLSVLFDGIMEISRLDSTDVDCVPQAVALDTLLARLVSTFDVQAESRGLDLDVDCPAGAMVVADPILLERVLMNLLGNAIKFTETGSVGIRVESRGERLALHVRDTGCGIPESEHERVFSAYQQIGGENTGQDVGHGLGLAIVRRSCDLMGVPISLASTLGKGSEFSLSLVSAEGSRPSTRAGHDAGERTGAAAESRKETVVSGASIV